MAQITDNEGNVHTFELMKFNENNVRKVNINTDGRANGEGIWAVLSDEDLVKYDNNTLKGDLIVMLANHSLHFMPLPSWGMHILAKFNGTNRAVADITRVDYSKKENRVWSEDVPEVERI